MNRSPALIRDDVPLDPINWVERHGDYLYRFAYARVGRDEVAQDLVQDALLAAWRGRQAFRGRASERSWLTAILKRKIIDWMRETVRERTDQPLGRDEWIDKQFPGGKWRTPPDEWRTGTPDAGVLRKEFWSIVRDCMEKLPARQRDAFVLWHLDDRATGDVCRATKTSAANVWVMLHRARFRMWRCLSRNWYGRDAQTGEDTP